MSRLNSSMPHFAQGEGCQCVELQALSLQILSVSGRGQVTKREVWCQNHTFGWHRYAFFGSWTRQLGTTVRGYCPLWTSGPTALLTHRSTKSRLAIRFWMLARDTFRMSNTVVSGISAVGLPDPTFEPVCSDRHEPTIDGGTRGGPNVVEPPEDEARVDRSISL